MTSAAEPTGTLETALSHARRLLDSNPVMAAEQAGEILKVVPNHPPATLLLAMARRMTGATPEAIEILRHLTDAQPNWAVAHCELGMALADAGQSAGAMVALRRAVALNPALPDAWRAIGDHLILSGDAEGADAAYAQHIKASTRDPRLLSAGAALVDGKIAQGEALLRAHLRLYPTDVAALRMQTPKCCSSAVSNWLPGQPRPGPPCPSRRD